MISLRGDLPSRWAAGACRRAWPSRACIDVTVLVAAGV